MRSRGITWLFGAAMAALLAFATNAAAEDKSPEQLFKARCASCHGSDGKGTSLGKTLGAKDWTNPASLKGLDDAALAKIIKQGKKVNGKPAMPAYDKLSDSEVTGLVKVVRSVAAKK